MANPKFVDPSLWWDPFTSLLTELENASLSDDISQHILDDNNAWFVGTLSVFKPQSVKSKEALNFDIVKVKEHSLAIKPDFKEKALRISSCLNLDEIKSYILVERYMEREFGASDSVSQEFIDMVSRAYRSSFLSSHKIHVPLYELESCDMFYELEFTSFCVFR
ncbi:unnamed protein product [Cochlearia groenlandica]